LIGRDRALEFLEGRDQTLEFLDGRDPRLSNFLGTHCKHHLLVVTRSKDYHGTPYLKLHAVTIKV
jgi:hypothetical protein